MNNVKDLNTRLSEALEIRKQLKRMGLFVIEANQDKMKQATNAFVKDGQSATFTLDTLDGKTSLKVLLYKEAGKQSGVHLIL